MRFSWSDYVTALANTEEIPARYQQLRIVQLAQAIVESARGTSRLFLEAGNPGGLKWRATVDENYSNKITHQLWLITPTEPDGAYWCEWRTAEHAVMGYWRFIDRRDAPYQGWQKFAKDPEGYLRHIWEKGYATDPNYVSKILKVFPEAKRLLDKYHQRNIDPTKTYKVAIMPGHGGPDSGAVNKSLGLKEKDYNWKEAVLLKERLEATGNYTVLICRSEDEDASLSGMQRTANNSGADVCLCLHHNACNQEAQGWWLFYANRSPEYEKFIKVMDKQFHNLPLKARSYDFAGKPFAQDWHSRVWSCIHACEMPTILFESCFIDNDSDATWLRDGGYVKVVDAICAGVQEYLGDLQPKPKDALFVKTNEPPANVYTGPGKYFAVAGHLDNGTPLTMTVQDGDWLKITQPIEGYVHKDIAQLSYRVFVNDPNSPLNVRSGPGTQHKAVGELMNGAPLTVVGSSNNWLQISEPMKGYVFASLTSTLYRVFVADANPPLNVRSGPGREFDVVMTLENNTALAVVDSQLDIRGKQWLQISSPCNGWVLERLTSDRVRDGVTQPPSENCSESEKYDYCVEIITRNGGHLKNRNIVSFRKETSTKANNWDGTYDDVTYVLWKDTSGKHVCQYTSNTEPSSQYEDSNDPRADRSIMGVDANGDGRRDLGRLPEGYYEYETDYSSSFGNILSPISSVLANRDINHNGRFEEHEPRATAGRSMLFHRGGVTNPYSAGCQTMPPQVYERFWRDLNLNGNPGVIGYTIVRWS